MIFDVSSNLEGFEYIIGFGLALGLAFVFTYLSKGNYRDFLLFFCLFSSFSVWVGLLDIWVLVLNLVIISVIILVSIMERKRQ